MRPQLSLFRPAAHSVLTNVTADQHHNQPVNVEFSDTTSTVEPLPGGPRIIDIEVPSETNIVMFNLRSLHTVAFASGKAGAIGIATDNTIEASCMSVGGHASLASTSYNAVYTKPSGASLLTHKVFDQSNNMTVALSDAHLVTSGSGRYLRLAFTNYGAFFETLNVWGEIGVIG